MWGDEEVSLCSSFGENAWKLASGRSGRVCWRNLWSPEEKTRSYSRGGFNPSKLKKICRTSPVAWERRSSKTAQGPRQEKWRSSRSGHWSCRLGKSFNRQLYKESLEFNEESQLSHWKRESKTTLGGDWWPLGLMQPCCEEVQTFICSTVSPHVTSRCMKGDYSSLSKCRVKNIFGEVVSASSPGIYFILSTPAYS